MAALLIGMSIMAIMMTVALPVWKQNAQREKEEELVFRGKQWVHGIALFQRKFVGAYPPNLNVLVEQRFVRRKWKDPITDDEFVPIPFGQQIVPGASSGPTAGRSGAGGQQTGSTIQSGTQAQNSGRGTSTFGSSSQQPIGGGGLGIQGVTSKSKDESIRIYNGRTHYNEWQFVYTAPAGRGAAQPGTVPGQTGPGQQQPGPPGVGPGGRGRGGDGRGRGFQPGDGRGGQFPGRGFGPGGQQFPQPGQPGGRGRG